MVQKLTKEQKDSILNYENEYQKLATFAIAVRKRPGMYIGHVGNSGHINMIREVFQNSIDEIIRTNSPATDVWVTYDERTNTIIIEDNGRGIPFKLLISNFTEAHMGTNFEKADGDYSSGTHGVGSKVTNALSVKFVVESYILGEARSIQFCKGIPSEEGIKKIDNPGKQGTIVAFTPDPEIMGQITTSCNDVLNLIQLLLPLAPIGARVHYKSIFHDGKSTTVDLTNTDGTMTYIIDSTKSPMFPPIQFGEDTGKLKINILLTYDSDMECEHTEKIYSFCNFCPTDTIESSHVRGFIAGLKSFFVDYMNKTFLVTANSNKNRKKSLTATEKDIRYGLRAVVEGACLEPIFTGQAKEIMDTKEMEPFVKQVTIEALKKWSQENAQYLNKLCKFFKDIIEIRMNGENEKTKLTKNYSAGIDGYQSKFTKPTKHKKEFFIVEGDSAGGSFKTNRDHRTQGVFPIRGMILNCFERPEQECLNNAEVSGILNVIGGGYGKKFDITKVPWEKVIACTDADAAGSEIEALLLRMMLRFCVPLIEHGRYYKAVAPLYYIEVSKNKKMYFSDRISLVKYIQAKFSKNTTICTLDGRKLKDGEVEELLYNNIDYIYELERISNKYRISADILELYLFNRDLPQKKIGQIINKKYRFMKYTEVNGHVVCEGIVDGVNNMLIMGDRILNESKDILKIISNNLYSEYLVNGEKKTLLHIMREYSSYSPSHIYRLKGLGEQNKKELAESVILPEELGGSRTLVQYTIADAKREIEEIRKFESNKIKLLEGLVVTRLDVAD